MVQWDARQSIELVKSDRCFSAPRVEGPINFMDLLISGTDTNYVVQIACWGLIVMIWADVQSSEKKLSFDHDCTVVTYNFRTVTDPVGCLTRSRPPSSRFRRKREAGSGVGDTVILELQ